MAPGRYRVFLWAAPVVFVSLLLIAVVPLNPSSNVLESTARQVLGGTLFGQTAIAATWAAFGPGPFMARLPLSLTWIAMQVAAAGISEKLNEGPSDDFVIVGILLFSQWLLLQLSLWGVAIGFGVQLRHSGDGESASTNQRQFGIRELMLVTAIVGVLFGIGRLAIPQVVQQEGFVQAVGPVMALLVVAEVAMTFPLVLGALLHRRALAGVLVALGLIAAATACEIPLMQMMGAGGSPILEVSALNVGTVAWMILLLSIVRASGYSLSRIPRPEET